MVQILFFPRIETGQLFAICHFVATKTIFFIIKFVDLFNFFGIHLQYNCDFNIFRLSDDKEDVSASMKVNRPIKVDGLMQVENLENMDVYILVS